MSQSGIMGFVGEGGLGRPPSSRVERFSELVKTKKTKEEQRSLERKLLKPAPLATYAGDAAAPLGTVESKSVLLVFANTDEIELFSKHFKVTKYMGQSCWKLELLLAFLRSLEEGTLSYDEETEQWKTITKRNRRSRPTEGDHSGEPEVGARKRRRKANRTKRVVSVAAHLKRNS